MLMSAARRKLDATALFTLRFISKGLISEEYTSELQSRGHLVCRLLLEKKKMNMNACAETTRTGDQHSKFFKKELIDIETTLQQFVYYFHSAALCLAVLHRSVLMMGTRE